MKCTFFSRTLAKEILLLAWPTMLQILMNTAVQYVDMAMVGSLGTRATAAIGATSAVSWLVNGSVSSLAIGFLSHISKAYGAGDLHRTRQIVEQAVLTVLVYGSVLTCLALAIGPFIPVWMQVEPFTQRLASQYFLLSYAPMLMRTATVIFGNVLWAMGDTKTPMLVSILVNFINIVCNFLLIFPTRQILGITIPGAGLGVIGAGIASCAAFCIESLCICLALWHNHPLSLNLRRIRPDRDILLPCIRTAIPNLVQRLGTSLAAILFASMINSLGAVATATHTIVNTIESACGCGFQRVSAPMAGQMAGGSDRKREWQFSRTLLFMEAALTSVIGILLFTFSPRLMRLFIKDPDVISLGTKILRMVALEEPFLRTGQIMEGILHGIGNTTVPFLYQISTIWSIRVAGTFFCTQILGYGLTSAWMCIIVQYGVLFLLLARHFLCNNEPAHTIPKDDQ